jgi:hypothetical protein
VSRKSSVVPSTKTVWNGQIPDGKVQNVPHVRSTSSPDPIAMCKDDQEIMMLKHSIPGSPREGASFKSEAVLAPPTHSQSSSKDKSRPKSAATGSVPKLSFAVVVPSPPKRSTHKSTRVKREPPERDSSRSQDRTPAAPDHGEKSKDPT